MADTFLTKKDLATRIIEQGEQFEKSPKVEGFIQGAKGALLAAPVAAAIQAIRGKSVGGGAFLAGVGAGVLTGLTAAAIQKFNNVKTEAGLRYHVRNLLDREPMVYMPPKQLLSQAMQESPRFGQGFENVYYSQ